MPLKSFPKTLQSNNKHVQIRMVFKMLINGIERALRRPCTSLQGGGCEGLYEDVKRPCKGLSWLLHMATANACNLVCLPSCMLCPERALIRSGVLQRRYNEQAQARERH